jgi:hypothetical protein
MNFQAGDLIITKDVYKHYKKRMATIIEIHDIECSAEWSDPYNASISYQYCDTGEKWRLNIKYFTHRFLPTVSAKARWKHIPVKT